MENSDPWKIHETCVYYVPDISKINTGKYKPAMAGFDLDGTLIKSNCLKQPVSPTDWNFSSPNVIQTLQQTFSNGYYICIFTNQIRFTSLIRTKIDNIRQTLESNGIFPFIFISTKYDKYRKPDTGMFRLFLGILQQNLPIQIDIQNLQSLSFYVGDAVGSTSHNPAYQWSDSDFKFAGSCGVRFYTPDQLF